MVAVPASFFAWFVFFMPELPRPRRQLHPGQPAGDAGAHRAGMVLPAVLRDPARDPGQARRRDRDVRLDRRPGLPALARHLAGALGDATARCTGSSSGSSSSSASASAGSAPSRPEGIYVIAARILTVYYFALLPDHPAAARHVREAEAAAELDRGRRCWARKSRARRTVMPMASHACIAARRSPASLSPASRSRRPRRRRRRRRVAAARRSGRSPARSASSTAAQLQRGFKVYKEVCAACHATEHARVPQSRRAGRSRLLGGAGGGARGRIQGQGRPERQGRDVRARRPAGRPLPVAVRRTSRRRAAANGGALPPDLSVIAKARTYERGFPLFVVRHLHAVPGAGPGLHHARCCRATRKPPAGLRAAGRAATTTSTSPATPSRCRSRCSDGQVTYDDGAPADGRRNTPRTSPPS